MDKTIAVLGPGAIGTTIAGALHEAGRTPTLCGRTARDQLTLTVDGLSIRIPGPVQTDPVQGSPADLVFLAVEATQLIRYGHHHGIPTPVSDLIVPLLAAASDGPG